MIRQLKLLYGDRGRRQRGSVLSGLLIIVAFLSILIGALMTELTTAFLISRSHTARVAREATATSAVELAIFQLQNSSVPPHCATDSRGPWYLSLNGNPAAVTPTCTAILPDLAKSLAAGAFAVDGTHELVAGRDSYLVGDLAGNLRSYPFGQTGLAWSIWTGGAVTAPPFAKADPIDVPAVGVLVPTANPGSGCGGHCVELFEDSGGTPVFRCAMAALSTVRTRPAGEASGTGPDHFPTYTFFGDDGGNLYVYDAYTDGACTLRRSAGGLGGAFVGDPLVFPGRVNSADGSTSTSDDVFAVLVSGGTTRLVHWRYSEVTDSFGNTTTRLVEAESPRSIAVGNASGYAINSTVPAVPSTLTLAFAGAAGNLAMATIAVAPGPSYSMSGGSAAPLVLGGVNRAPYWCHCPGQDLIGVGSTDGTLYLLDTGLNLTWSYSGVTDGSPAINTTPAADASGSWYFGADDGFVYDVELPSSGKQMFKAARFGPGGAIRSSPVMGGGADGCGQGPCLYFASSTSGAYFTQMGSTRVLDLRACVSAAFGSTTCAVNPRLWARVEVGSPAIVGGNGVKVLGWSYYAP
ncbi:MAG TPA: hypothetical protein VGU71_11900 [Candidatus Dormibacteraeota bacterium]|nr:hypothetical protein [Candidatus Dormibacteraeota bacterium]